MSFDMHDKTISVSDLTDFLDANPDPDEDEKDSRDEDTREKCSLIKEALENLEGCGDRSHSWNSNRYPSLLVSEHHFAEYAKQVALDLGMISSDRGWPFDHIDWEAAGEALQTEYSDVEIDGETYWYRND